MGINIYGLIIVVAIMVPNIIFAIKCKDGFENAEISKTLEIAEQIGRFGCIAFMIIHVPSWCFEWYCAEAFAIYIAINALLVLAYCAIWTVCFWKNSMFKVLSLAILPSMIFIFSGIMSGSVALMAAACLFAPCHIAISYKNLLQERKNHNANSSASSRS